MSPGLSGGLTDEKATELDDIEVAPCTVRTRTKSRYSSTGRGYHSGTQRAIQCSVTSSTASSSLQRRRLAPTKVRRFDCSARNWAPSSVRRPVPTSPP